MRARKEVIMSAGTTNTAQLLKLSGIGPREELEKFGVNKNTTTLVFSLKFRFL